MSFKLIFPTAIKGADEMHRAFKFKLHNFISEKKQHDPIVLPGGEEVIFNDLFPNHESQLFDMSLDYMGERTAESSKFVVMDEATDSIYKKICEDVSTLKNQQCEIEFDGYLDNPFEQVWFESGGVKSFFTIPLSDGGEAKIFAFQIVENPTGYNFFALAQDGNHENLFLENFIRKQRTEGDALGPLLNMFFKHMREKDMVTAVVKVNERIRLSSNKGRELVKVKRVFYVNKKCKNNPSVISGNRVEWKHSWECSGHWRRISGIGKNRQGQYEMNGITWVNPCIKGDGPLVKKLRVVS